MNAPATRGPFEAISRDPLPGEEHITDALGRVWIVIGRLEEDGNKHTVAICPACITHSDRAKLDALGIAAALNRMELRGQ